MPPQSTRMFLFVRGLWGNGRATVRTRKAATDMRVMLRGPLSPRSTAEQVWQVPHRCTRRQEESSWSGAEWIQLVG